MDTKNDVIEFLNNHESLVNDGDFEELFEEADKIWYSASAHMKLLYKVIKLSNLDPKIEEHIPSMLRVYNQIIDAGATFIGWDYMYETEDDKEWYKQHEGKHGKFMGLGYGADYNINDGKHDDADNFIDSFWNFKFDNGDRMDAIAGSAFRLDKPLNY